MNNGLIIKIDNTFYCIKSFINPKFEYHHTKIIMSKQTKGYLVSKSLH